MFILTLPGNFSKVSKYKVNTQNGLCFYTLAINHSKEIKKTVPCVISSQRKYLGVNQGNKTFIE
jgi:hypothetical protein